MKPTEPTHEDWEEYSRSLEVDREQQEALRLWAEEEEAERDRTQRPHGGCGHPEYEPEFDGSEEDDNLPD